MKANDYRVSVLRSPNSPTSEFPLSTSQEEVFFANVDDQTEVPVEIFQGRP